MVNTKDEILALPVDNSMIEQNEDTIKEAIDILDVDTDISEEEKAQDSNALKFLGLQSKIQDIKSLKDNMISEQKKLLDVDESYDIIDRLLENFTLDQVKAMDYKFINEILVDNDGNPIKFIIDFDNDKMLNEFKKDFLVLRKESLDSFAKFDEELVKINEEIAESQKEFEEYIKQFGNISNYVYTKLVNKLKDAKTDREKEITIKLLNAYNNAITLDNLKSYAKTYKGKNIIGDFRDNKKSQYIYRRYKKVIATLNINTDLTSFTTLEKRFLPEEYHKRPNIFMFMVIHFVSSWLYKEYTRADGLFLAQLVMNLKNLYYDTFEKEEDKEEFITNIKACVDIIA